MNSVSVEANASGVSVDTLAERVRQLRIGRQGERPSNSRAFQRFLELLSMQCSNGSRFLCVEKSGRCCQHCEEVRRHIATYIDVATLEEICNTRKQSGICSYIYCNKRLVVRTKGATRAASIFKIDVAARKIYRRRLYESFCSSNCIERHAEVEAVAKRSPMETGIITPRAVKNTSPKTVHDLLKRLQQLDMCDGNVVTYVPGKPTWPYGQSSEAFSEAVTDKCVLFNYKPVNQEKVVRFALPEEESDSVESVDTIENNMQEQTEWNSQSVSMDLSSTTAKDNSVSTSKKSQSYGYHNQFYGLYGFPYKQESIFTCLSVFSIMWYTLSTCVTYKTGDFFRNGKTEETSLDGKAREWYEAMVPQLPEDIAPFVIRPLYSLLCTLRIGKNTPDIDDDYIRVLMYLLAYVLIYKKDALLSPGEIAKISPVQWKAHLQNLEEVLIICCQLDADSIAVMKDLLIGCD